jgi:hypothetical protein
MQNLNNVEKVASKTQLRFLCKFEQLRFLSNFEQLWAI